MFRIRLAGITVEIDNRHNLVFEQCKNYLCDDCATHMELLKKCLDAKGIEYEIDTSIVRGLDYYSRTVFEFVSTDIGAQGTVCGGGRYDGLVEELGGNSTPACGFALGMERLLLTLEEQAALHSAADRSITPAAFGIIFTLSTGIRLGELLGLQWGDLDYENQAIRIRRTVGRLQRIDESGQLIPKGLGIPTTEIVARSPKSKNAQRTIPLFPKVWNDLMIYRDKQKDLFTLLGIAPTSTTPIFSTPLGLMYEPRTYEDLFKRTLKEAKVSDINFHALRHTFATRALEAGMDIKVLSSILGHAQASTTLNLYAHALPDHKRVSMEKMGEFYGSVLHSA